MGVGFVAEALQSINPLVCAPKLPLASATDGTGLKDFLVQGYFRDWGPKDSTKFLPRNKPHARDLWGWEAKWLPLGRARDSDRPGCDGGLYGGTELVTSEDTARTRAALAVSNGQQ